MRWKINSDPRSPYVAEWDAYLNKLYPYLNICSGKDVLEIGPLIGTQVIQAHNPKSLTLVEGNTQSISKLQERYKNATIVNDDIFLYLENYHKFDIVICSGVLYHFHSPLYLLELLVNRTSPDIIVIETYVSDSSSFQDEPDNNFGARQINEGWKSAKISVIIPKEIIINAMKNMGYDATVLDVMHKPKSFNPHFFAIFKKI